MPKSKDMLKRHLQKRGDEGHAVDDSSCLIEVPAFEQRQAQVGSVKGNVEGQVVFAGQLERGAYVGFSVG
jgi:hypothetical protein